VIPNFFQRELCVDTRTERGDHPLDFCIPSAQIEASFFDIEDFSAQRQNRLRLWVSALDGGAPSAVFLNNENF